MSGEERWLPKCVTPDDLKVRGTVQKEVHPRNRGGSKVLLLREEFAPQCAVITVVLTDVMNHLQQHTARAASRIVNNLAFFGVENVDHQPHNRSRGVKLACLFVCEISKLLDQVFVGLAENVRLRCRISQRDP